MCFTVDRKAKAPQQTRVYKVVRVGLEDVSSPFKHHTWVEGETYTISRNSAISRTKYGELRANAGFYVLFTRRDAEKAVRGCKTLGILELDVSPKDWLFTSTEDGALARRNWEHRTNSSPRFMSATYRRVRVAKQQRYIRWVK